jgi:septum formation protein
VRSSPPARLILASASPRRNSLLREAGYSFDVIPGDVDEENVPPGMLPSELALHLATLKARAVATQQPDCVVLAADTVVAFGDMILGKPRHADHARQMLRLLSGTTHVVITGVCVMHLERNISTSMRVMSAVHMRAMTDAEIERYVASNQWQGKAGGYGIQDDDPFVTRMAGCHTNIVGLPMTTTRRMLAEAGIEPTIRS